MKSRKIDMTHFRLMLITQGSSPKEIEHEVEAFLNGGGKWVQLRMKEQPFDLVQAVAEKIALRCFDFGATFIINDFPYIAMHQYVAGVHLGKNDMTVLEARNLLGNHKIIGATANTLQDIQLHIASGADYVGLGPFRFTTTKKNLSPTLGLDYYWEVIQQLKIYGRSIPIVAIGGIKLEDVKELMATGIDGIAVSGAICQASDQQQATIQLLNELNQTVQSTNN